MKTRKRNRLLLDHQNKLYEKNPHPVLEHLEPSDTLVFYGFSPLYITGLRLVLPKIKCIEIPIGKFYTEILGKKPCEWYPLLYLKKYPRNTYAKMIVDEVQDSQNVIKSDFLPWKNLKWGCANASGLHPGEGLFNRHLLSDEMKKICNWAKNDINTQRTIIFDLAYVISVTWFYFRDNMNINKVDIIHYLVGTKERFHSLKEMFSHLKQNKITVFIKYVSGQIIEKTIIPFLVDLIKILCPYFEQKCLIYDGEITTNAFLNNKYLMKIYDKKTPR